MSDRYTEWIRGIKRGEQWKVCWAVEIGDKGHKVSIWRSNCNNGVVRNKGMVMRNAERRKVNVLGIKCLRSLVGVSRIDRVRNEEVHMIAGIKSSLRVEQFREYWDGLGMWKEWMIEYHVARRGLMAEVTGGRVRCRPMLGWMDGVKVALSSEEWWWRLRNNARKIGTSGAIEHSFICNWMSFKHPFLVALCSFRPPSRALVVITWRGVGCVTWCGWGKL